jgi:hypothetical protein
MTSQDFMHVRSFLRPTNGGILIQRFPAFLGGVIMSEACDVITPEGCNVIMPEACDVIVPEACDVIVAKVSLTRDR